MKKIYFIIGFFVFSFSFFSCTCECVGPDNQDPADKICKTEYENLYGQGTWANYESSVKQNNGYICK